MPTRQQNMPHYYGAPTAAGETFGGSRGESLRQSTAYPSRKLKTAGNPIGIQDMSENFGGYNKRSLGGRTNSQFTTMQQTQFMRPGVQTAGENKRSRIKRSHLAGSFSGVTASTSHKGGHYGGGFKIA